MFLNRSNITLEGQNKWWKTLNKLTGQSHLNLNEWEDQEVLCLSKNNTGNTDKPQKEGIDRFDEENRCNVGNIINHTASLKQNFRNVLKLRIHKDQVGNLTCCRISLCHHNRTIRFTQCQDIIDTITSHGCGMSISIERLD